MHCCTHHGCKYGLDICTVAMGLETGYPCELCQEEAEAAQRQLEILVKDAETLGPVLQKITARFQRDFAPYLCGCDTTGQTEALTQALRTAIVEYLQQVLK